MAMIWGINVMRFIPHKGEHRLSVNLAIADPAHVFKVAEILGFKPELVQLENRFGVELHALLFAEQTDGSAMSWPELDHKIDQLADLINPQAISHVYGGRIEAA